MLLAPLIASVALLAVVLELVRRRRLREELSWLWVVGATTAVVLSGWEGGRTALATLAGTDERATASLLFTCIFLTVLLLQLSTRISGLANHEKNLAQHVARLEKRIADLEHERDDE